MTTGLIALNRNAPTDARQIRSRNALKAALLSLLEQQPFDQITIREITARAGTGYATFFRHYPAKDALLGDVAADEIAALLAMTIPMWREADSFESTLALCTFVADHPGLWTSLLTGGAASIVREDFVRQARKLAGTGTAGQNWLPGDLGLVHGTSSTFDILAWWLGQERKHSVEQIAMILHRLVIQPLVGAPIRQTAPAD